MLTKIVQTLSLTFLLSAPTYAAISSGKNKVLPNSQTAQLVNLNLQVRTNNKTLKSDLTMPFYQTAELEKKFGTRSYNIEVVPKRGKKPDEVELDVKFFNPINGKSVFHTEMVAKVNKDSHINHRGFSIRVRPVLN